MRVCVCMLVAVGNLIAFTIDSDAKRQADYYVVVVVGSVELFGAFSTHSS